MQKFEHGVVKFFDSRDNKRFGFILLESGEEVFFHFNDARYPYVKGNQLLFKERRAVKRKNGTIGYCVQTDPKTGSVVYFIRTDGYKGPKASPWTHEENIRRIQPMLDALERRLSVRYRYMSEVTFWRNPDVDCGGPKVAFEGTLEELTEKYPPTDVEYLGSSFSHDDGFSMNRWVEMQQEDDSWKRCDDPREMPVEA